MSFRPSFLRPILLGALTGSGLLATGCGNMVTTASSANSFSSPATITGSLHGGNQPVTGATVTLYAAGATGYGSAATQYATTMSRNDSAGSFSFTKSASNTGPTTPTTATYGCPATGDPQMYILATGGNTQGAGNGANDQAAFIAALGACSTISAATFVDMNEVTSVGTLAALQQYFNPLTDQFGYPASTQGTQGFLNAVTTIPNLVNIANGTANASSTLTATPSGSTAAVTVTVTPEQAKLNTIANITAACVNTASTATATSANCTTLFTNANYGNAGTSSQPSSVFQTATDVIQATYYILTNPGSESTAGTNNPTAMANLFALSSAQAPFQPTLASAPTDWTIGIRYSSASPCTYGTFLTAAYSLATDATGNIWIASGGTSTTTSNLIALTPNGTPATCALGASVALTKGLTIDTAGNVWIASNAAGSPFYKYSTTANTSTAFATSGTSVPYTVAADGSGNIFYTDAANKVVNEFVGGAAAPAAVAQTNIATVNTYPYFMAIDTAGKILVPNSTTTNILYSIYPSTGTGNTNGYLTSTLVTVASVVNPYAVAAGRQGRFYVGNSTSASSTVSQTSFYLTTATDGTAVFGTNSAQYSGGIGAPRGPNAIDGAGNIWYANSLAATGNYVTGATTSGLFTVSEFTSANLPLSPSGQNGGFQKDTTIFNTAPRGLTIDLSGNVWGGSNSGTGQGVFEIVGAAVPVITPIAKSLQTSIAAGSTNAVSKP